MTSTGKEHKLNCLIQGEINAFTVSTTNVNHLEQLEAIPIHREGDKGTFRDISVKVLTLWKACKSFI